MRELLTPRQVAQAIGVSEASLKRWCDKGLIPTVRTGGGHRRLPINGVMQFLRTSGHSLVRPEVLGLPAGTGRSESTLDRARQDIITALEAGDEARLRGLVFSLYLGGHTAVDICDLLLAPAFQELGARWQHGALEVYEERRGCEICLRVLYQLRQSLPTIPAEAPRAIGATLEGDPYMLPTAMVAIALREAGWNAESYGCWHPAETLGAAVREERPRLLWISVSTLDDAEAFVARYTSLYHSAVASGVAVAVGGRALTEPLRRRIEYSAYGDCLRHLVAFVATLRA